MNKLICKDITDILKNLERKVNCFLQMKLFLFLFLYLFLLSELNSQDYSLMKIPFFKSQTALQFPTTGGLKNAMFSNIDFNNDGKKDLFVFDKEGEVISPFLYTGTQNEVAYQYAPEYIINFPKLKNFAMLVDFNQDGVEDIFTGGEIPSTIEVYKGKRINNDLSFDLVTFSFPGSLGNFLQIFQNGFSQVYISSIDIMAVVDVDFDGDIDILSFPPASDKLTFYENVSVDEDLPIDSLKYRINTSCWGGFKEDEFSASVFFSSSPSDCYNFTEPGKGEIRHSGSTSLLLDIDGDQDMDLLLGDLTNEHIKLLYNHGDKSRAWINSADHTFPSSNDAAKLQVFLAAYHVDVNNDGARDLIITPNDRNDSEREKHIWLYINHGLDNKPDFQLFTKSFLLDQTISLGSGSHPCFLDYNGDGLIDLLIGGNGVIQADGSRRTWLELYLNTGTGNAPAYTIEDDDFLEFSKFANPVLRLAPTVGDLDGDGDVDLMIGEFFGNLFYFENLGGVGNPMNFEPRIYPYKDIFIGNNSKPSLWDLNKDGLKDIIIGEVNNELNYFQNIGTIGNPTFNIDVSELPNTRNLGLLFSGQSNYFTESGAPFFVETIEADLLFFGSQGGQLKIYNVHQDPTQLFEKLDDHVGFIHVGTRIVPSMADIDMDGYYELVLGNERGGITFYNTPFQLKTVSSDEENQSDPLKIYPNPAYNFVLIPDEEGIKVTVFDANSVELNLPLHGRELDVSRLAAGVYFIQLQTVSKQNIYKLIVVR
ncbi:MAG: T9SS type A sorting domain-containing protein [Saprospiraceae bacterium]